MNRVNQDNIVELTETRPAVQNDTPRQMQALSFPINALVIGGSIELKDNLEGLFKYISNLHVSYSAMIPDQINQYNLAILIINTERTDIKAYIQQLTSTGINIILLGDDMDSDLIRAAIHYQVKDIISMADIEHEIVNALIHCANDIVEKCNIAPVFTIINGKSGSGASFITSCLGEIAASLSTKELALIDADLNYGSLADSLNLEPSYFLDNAINEINQLDNVAIKSMMAKRNNLALLASKPYSQLNSNEREYFAQLEQLLWKIKLNHDLVLIDLSRGLESHTLPLLTLSNHVLLVLQQNIISLRETKALMRQLTKRMGISQESIHIIVNRYSPKVTNITLSDVKKVLNVQDVYCVGNNYQLASACSDCGSPLLKLSDNKIIRRDICHIINELFPIEVAPQKPSLYNRIFRSS